MSFRWLFWFVAAALTVLTAAGIATLLFTTRYLDVMASHVGEVGETIRAGIEIEVNLLRHDRAAYRLARGGGTQYARAGETARAQLDRWLGVARRNAAGSAEAELVDEIERAVRAYFSTIGPVEVAGRQDTGSWGDAEDSLAAAIQASERLVQFNMAEAEGMHARARRWNRAATTAGIAIGIVLVLIEAAALGTIRFGVARPLESLRGGMSRFADGRGSERLPERGTAELREVTRTFNEMAATLERHRERQLGFMAGVVHDLRNPMSALRVAVATLGPDRPLPAEDRLRPLLSLIARQVDRLERMLGDLLDAVRISAGRLALHLEKRDLREAARAVVALYERVSAAHELVLLASDEPVPVRHDSVRIEQVLNNLVSNAIKYSPGGGRVEVQLVRDRAEAVLSVSDQGLGIPPDEQERIFEPFRRGRRFGEDIPGAGLGLFVSRRIVEAHGGRIFVQSTPGLGSTFLVRLPLAS